MIFNMTGGAGSNSALNFKVIGSTTRPENPTENMIWVNTDVAITEWLFSATEPNSPTEGMVWFRIDDSSLKSFNALKDNIITIYYIEQKQYINGVWVVKFSEIYQNGAWSVLKLTIFEDGNQFMDITGGWETFSQYSCTASVNSGNITLTAKGTTNKDTLCSAYTKNKIDVTQYKTLRINTDWVTSKSSSGSWVYVGLYNNEPTSFTVLYDHVARIDYNSYELDVSTLKGSYHVGVTATTGGVTSYTANLKVTEVCLE